MSGIYVLDNSSTTSKTVQLPINGGTAITLYGNDEIWGTDSKYWEPVYASGDTKIEMYYDRNIESIKYVKFDRITSQNYYEMRLDETAKIGTSEKITVSKAVLTELTKYDEESLWR